MHLVLNEEIYQRHQCAKEASCQPLSILQGSRVLRAEQYATHCPRKCSHKIGDHEDIMPSVIICGSDICPSSTTQSTKDADACYDFWKCCIWTCGKDIPKEYKGKTGS